MAMTTLVVAVLCPVKLQSRLELSDEYEPAEMLGLKLL